MPIAPSTVTADAAPTPAGRSTYYGDAPSRVVAYAIDALLLTVVVFVAAVVVSAAFGPAVRFTSPGVSVSRGLAMADAVVATGINAAYFVLAWILFRGSPGQRLLGMQIGAEVDGGALTLRQAATRWILLGLPLGVAGFLTTLLAGVGDAIVDLLAVAWYLVLLVSTARSRTKQGLHDRAAGTVVVKSALPVPWDRAQPADADVR